MNCVDRHLTDQKGWILDRTFTVRLRNSKDCPQDCPQDMLRYKSKDRRVQGEQPPLVGKAPTGVHVPERLTVHHQKHR
jgi:hypothetical protein